jgi:hypothetical protein
MMPLAIKPGRRSLRMIRESEDLPEQGTFFGAGMDAGQAMPWTLRGQESPAVFVDKSGHPRINFI